MGPKTRGGSLPGGRGVWTTSKLRRQEAVSRLRLRKASALEIWEALKEQPTYRNPRTGEPWSYSVICRDISELDAWYEEQARKSTVFFRGRQLTELEELRRAAWEKEDLWLVLKTLEREAKLTNTESPVQVDLTSAGEALPSVQEMVQIFLQVRDTNLLMLPDAGAQIIDVEAEAA